MITFTINVTEINKGYVTVEANSRSEAKKLARLAWFQGQTCWGDGDVVIELSEEEVSV